jgi:acetyl-CoA C-acetyltransferase
MAERVVIAGVGMVPFTATGVSAAGMAERAIRNALEDAGIDADLVDQAIASHVLGHPGAGEHALAREGVTGIPVSNVSNGAASGSTALFHARQALLSGDAQCALAVGFEETLAASTLEPGLVACCGTQLGWLVRRFGIADETFARVAAKAYAHGARNPHAAHRGPLSPEEALAAPLIAGRLRRPYVSSASCGAAAVVLCTARFASQHGLRDDVLLVAQALESDNAGDGDDPGAEDALAASTTRRVAERAYESAGIDPADIDVAEVHDFCVGEELISCAALGLCAADDIGRFVASGANTYGGKVVVSPSGGLLSLGNAPGATGLAQICELTWQLRGEAGSRQVPRARIALQHNGGFGSGAVTVAILRRKQ